MQNCLTNTRSQMMLGADPYASSNAQYINELASIERRLMDIESQMQNESLSETTRQGMLNEKVGLLSRKSAIQWWLSLSTAEKNKRNGLTAVSQKQASYQNSLQKLKNQYDTSGTDIFSSLTDMNIAGIPLIGVILIVGAGIYLFTTYKKKK